MEKKVPDYRGKRILIVEDNHLNMEIFEEILGQTGLKMEEAYDGAEAIEKVAGSEEGYYDLILTDIWMLQMNGYVMTETIRAMKREDVKVVPIIGMTADVEACSVEMARNVGMNDQIYKPFSVDEIAVLFDRYLECKSAELTKIG